MAKYICVDCGCVFDEDEMGTYTEHHPYGMGYAEEVFGCCPMCKGDFTEAERCDECGEYFAKEDLEDGFCEECLKELEEAENE